MPYEKPPGKTSFKAPGPFFFPFRSTGPRGVGKTTWLKNVLPEAIYFDLLDAPLFLELSHNPSNLGPMIGDRPEKSWVVVDEIQKIPELLDEVHRLTGSGWVLPWKT